MPGQYLKVKVNFSWHLIWIFALLEGITVPLVPLFTQNGPDVSTTAAATTAAVQVAFAKAMVVIGIYGACIGFIGALVVWLFSNYVVFRLVRLRLNDAIITGIARPAVFALWGGALLAVIFWIQYCIVRLLTFHWVINSMILGFVSAAGGITFTGVVYVLMTKRFPYLGIKLLTAEQRLLLVEVPIASFAMLVGLYEGLAMPVLHIWALVPQHKVLVALLVGLSGGALSSLIVVSLAHARVINTRMWLKFLVLVSSAATGEGATSHRPG